MCAHTFDLYLFSPREYNFLNEQLLKAALMKQTKGCPTSCLLFCSGAWKMINISDTIYSNSFKLKAQL